MGRRVCGPKRPDGGLQGRPTGAAASRLQVHPLASLTHHSSTVPMEETTTTSCQVHFCDMVAHGSSILRCTPGSKAAQRESRKAPAAAAAERRR